MPGKRSTLLQTFACPLPDPTILQASTCARQTTHICMFQRLMFSPLVPGTRTPMPSLAPRARRFWSSIFGTQPHLRADLRFCNFSESRGVRCDECCCTRGTAGAEATAPGQRLTRFAMTCDHEGAACGWQNHL